MTAKGMLPLLLTTSVSLLMFVAYRSHFLQRTSRLLTILIVGSLHVAKQCVFERVGDPAWFCYNEAHYTANLCSLPAPVLSLALRRVTGKSLRTKTSAVYALISHFLSVRSEYLHLMISDSWRSRSRSLSLRGVSGLEGS